MHASRRVRRLRDDRSLGAGLVVAALASCGESRDPGADVATDVSTGDGWKTIEYRGVEVEVPASWTEADMKDCQFKFGRWTPPDLAACGPDGGLAFYVSATFDPPHGPGIRHDDTAQRLTGLGGLSSTPATSQATSPTTTATWSNTC